MKIPIRHFVVEEIRSMEVSKLMKECCTSNEDNQVAAVTDTGPSEVNMVHGLVYTYGVIPGGLRNRPWQRLEAQECFDWKIHGSSKGR